MNIIYTTVDGHFYTSLETGAIDTNSTAISMLLSQPLLMHNTYIMSFYFRSIKNISIFYPIKLIIGYSDNDSTFGVSVDTTGIPDTVWTKQFVYLTPDFDAQYITVMGLPGVLNQYTIVDKFSFDSTGLYLSHFDMQEKLIEIFPNPCTKMLQIKARNIFDIKIYNLLGEIQMALIFKLGIDNQSIDVSQLPRGIYFIQVISNDKILVKQFLKY